MRLNKNHKIVIGLILLVVVLFYFNNSNEQDEVEVCFNENCFDVEIANNEIERTKGLMFRKKLCENCGMLFIFDEPTNSKFWMKNTLIELDIIWIDSQGEVIYIEERVQPCREKECESYGPEKEKALYVLELNGGKSEEIGLKVGDRLDLRNIFKSRQI